MLVAGSLLGAFASLAVPPHWIGLLGVVPIFFGIRHLRASREGAPSFALPGEPSRNGSALQPLTYQVAAITIADGADNFGIYIPLFAAAGIRGALILGALFLGLVGLLCLIGLRLSRRPAVAGSLQRIGHLLVPAVLIGLGMYILWSAGTIAWIATGFL